MKPKNSKERRISFLKFLVLFVVTVATILAAFYFDFKVPAKENETLRKEYASHITEKTFQNGFYDEMKGLKQMIDSLDIPGQNVSYQNQLISAEIVDIQNKIPVTNAHYDMNMSIIQLYVELQTAKEKLNELRDAEGIIQEYKAELDKCREELKHVERELSIERR